MKHQNYPKNKSFNENEFKKFSVLIHRDTLFSLIYNSKFSNKRYFLIFTLIIFSFSLKANYIFTTNCKNAYEAIFNLKLAQAKAIIKTEEKTNPDNLYALFIENYINTVEVIIDGTKNAYNSYLDAFDDRLSKIKKGPKGSPYYLYFQSEMYLHKTLLCGQFSDFISAGISFYKSYKLLEDNIKEYPNFILNKKVKGLHELIMSIIPEEYTNLFSFIGLKGTSETGINFLKEFYEYSKTDKAFYGEAGIFLYFALAQFGKNQKDVLKFTENEKFSVSDVLSLRLCYLLLLKETQKTDDALDYFENIKNELLSLNIPHIYYLIGSIKITRLDEDANIYLEKFLNSYNGEHFVKHTYYKLACYYYLHNNDLKFKECTEKIKSKGATIIEYDKQALYHINNLPMPNKNLIKAKYLYDGGYYAKAKEIMIKSVPEFKQETLQNKVLFFYRIGTIYVALNDDDKAISNLNKAIQYGKNMKFDFVSGAALELGQLYENRGEYSKALEMYNKCIELNDSKYYMSIDRKAKLGIKRVKKQL
jgi:tetratricopeptide (TPR) repeat protein